MWIGDLWSNAITCFGALPAIGLRLGQVSVWWYVRKWGRKAPVVSSL